MLKPYLLVKIIFILKSIKINQNFKMYLFKKFKNNTNIENKLIN